MATNQESRTKAAPPPFDPNNQAGLGMGGASTQEVVYGPDGTAYGNPAIARAAGVTNYTMSPPAAPPAPTPLGAAAPPYTQQYAPGNFRPELIEDTNTPKPLPTRYGDPIYGLQGKDDIRTLIGRVGMAPVVKYDNRDGPPTITFADDPAYQKSQAILDFEKRIASGEIQESGLYGPQIGSGREIDRRPFVERESAYQSYDPEKDIFRFYDPEGNITQEGPRAGSVLGGALGDLMTGLNQTAANPDFQKAVMLAAIAAGGYAALGGGAAAGTAGTAAGAGAAPALTPAALESLIGSAGYGVNSAALAAAPALGIPVATVGSGALLGFGGVTPTLTPAAIESLVGSAGYGTNASALEYASQLGLDPSTVGSGAFGGSGSLFDAAESPLASGYGGPTSTALTNEAVASGMSPGSLGAQMAVDGTLSSEALAAAYGTTGPGSALYNTATLGNANALANQLAEAGTASNLAKLLGGGSQPSLSQLAINMLGTQDSGKNPGGFLDPTNLSTGSAQQNASILRDLPQLAFGHGPTVAALANRTAPQGYKRGGLAGHQPEFITGATGHYVKGKGDGQSDDIPAMLADGEYVFDADTVAALGNGSSDAGAQRLDEMRQAIRKHKRSAPVDKIPPKAKSPLEYLKG